MVEEVEGLVEKLGGVLVLESGGKGLFGKFFALGIGGDGDVEVRRVRVAEAGLQIELAGGRVQEVRAADNVGDALGVIIDDDGKLVGPETIGAQ